MKNINQSQHIPLETKNKKRPITLIFFRNKEKGSLVETIIVVAMVVVFVVLVGAFISSASNEKAEELASALDDTLYTSEMSFYAEDPSAYGEEELTEIVKTYFTTHTVSRTEHDEYIKNLGNISATSNITDVFNETQFAELSEKEQDNKLKELKEIITTEKLYDLSPYKTNLELFQAYKKIHFKNILWATNPYNVVANIKADGDTPLIEDNSTVYNSFSPNPKSWSIWSNNDEKLDSELFLNGLTFIMKDGEWLVVLK